MDSQYNSNYMPYAQAQGAPSSSLSAYASQSQQSGTPQSSLAAAAAAVPPQQQLNRNDSSNHTPTNAVTAATTLPPLQSQNGFSQFASLSFAHPSSATQTPTAPPTPVTQPSNGYAHLSPANNISHAHAAFDSHYPIATPPMAFPPSSSASAMPITQTSGLPTIRPMPPSSVAGSLASLPGLATAHLAQQPAFMSNEEAPTHVVGSQGRRGILPSAPGRPTANTAAAAAAAATAAVAASINGMPTKSATLQKDANGKFPCPHCNKTYLHAKHLKRHMLRHTGDRPYSCHLCKDTFSRSDILKRHFAKCSIRRGNPSGLSHLAHQRRPANSANRLSTGQQDGPIGLASLSEVAGTNPYSAAGLVEQSTPINGNSSTRTSRANSLITPGSMSHRNSINGLGIMSPNGHGPDISHAQPHFASPNMHGYGITNGGPLPSAYAFAQPAINPQYYQPMQPQPPLPYLNHSSSRYDHGHSNSPHQQSPAVGDPSQQQLDGARLLSHDGQDGFINGNVNMSNENSKGEHDKSFQGDFGDGGSAPLGPPWQ